MAATVLPSAGIALHGAPDSDIGTKDAKTSAIQVMQLEMTQDVVDELLESVRSGKHPQILFGRTPQLKYGDKSHVLQTSSESFRYELYQSSGVGSDDDLTFTGLINHSLAVQKAEDVTAGVDTALEQLKSSIAAISELKEANKTIVGDATPSGTPGHRRFPSKSLKAQHLNPPSAIGSPLRSIPSSPAMTLPKYMESGPTSQPGGSQEAYVKALRKPMIHLLAMGSQRESWLQWNCRATPHSIREVLPKIAKRNSNNELQFVLADKAYKELTPYEFPYKTAEDRQRAIENAIKAYDRLRLPKDDEHWQSLLPKEERNRGKCLSRLNVQAVQAPAPKASTPMHKILTDKKPTATKKSNEKDGEKEAKKVKEPKEKAAVKDDSEKPRQKKAVKDDSEKASTATKLTFTKNTSSSTETPKARNKKPALASEASSTPRVKPKTSARDVAQKERVTKPSKPSMPVNTKPKNPSPLSASPPVNASDFEHNHPVHKALSAAPSPAKTSSGNSDRSLKRKTNDADGDIHNHNLSIKQPRMDRATPNNTPLSSTSRINGTTPSSGNSLKRKADDSSAANTPSIKHRKVTSIDTHIANRYPNHSNNPTSPGESSSATTSPSLPSLSFRQTVELSQKFQKYYKKYEELYWQLAEADKAPTESQREDLMKMHRKLEEMKREIKAGAGVKH
ncbi:hypothetical protein K469DRAFT_585774 [Zopfia rhizophila CBS 207.26]|uniref:Uncharacterized protein n=1 Tax=Zopfia rhizophila CBS 207.26 TaxID=1314779 RepID=A0A6A6DUY7_9PEZI|nr:hypothetical protein K469DRAFT_585774 [Zopfia rhizophila CBS 207.26]